MVSAAEETMQKFVYLGFADGSHGKNFCCRLAIMFLIIAEHAV